MNVNRLIRVRNSDAVEALQEFLAAWWSHYKLEALLAPVELPNRSGVAAQVIEDRAALATVNPFAPVMLGNSASAFGQLAQEHHGHRIAVMLRPCELRALVELRKRGRIPSDSQPAVTIGVDCLGTFPPGDYAQCVKTRGAAEMTCQALQYAAEGGFSPQRLRMACQMCDWPAPCGADVTIGAIGVMPDQYLLLIARDEATDARLGLGSVAGDLATEAQVARREVAVGAVADKRASTRKALIEEFRTEHRFGDVGSALAWFATCSLCGDCLDACPLYNGELTGLLGVRSTRSTGRAPLAELVEVSRWLASCAGCGMCEEACANHVPLTLLIAALSHHIREELHYTAGDPAQQPAWLAY